MRRRKGQSLIELALALPVLLIMLTGLLEFGFALNQYLNALDAAREGARFASDGDPTQRQVPTDPSTCSTTKDFYLQTACIAEQTMAPVPLTAANNDDIVISVFRVLSGTVLARWPSCDMVKNPNSDQCVNDPPHYWKTQGEWHLFGKGSQCSNGFDNIGSGAINTGCVNPADAVGGVPEHTCYPNTDPTCHPSRFKTSDIQALIDPNAPNTGVVLVEVFYNYSQLLKLPWITAFVPDPLLMHSYTIIPVPAAEPSLAITGTVTCPSCSPSGGLQAVTINFTGGAGAVAVTDSNGLYKANGFSAGTVVVTPQPFQDCTYSPPNWTVTLVNQDVPDVDFVATCPDTPTPTVTPSLTPTPTQTFTPVPGATSTPTPTNTATPTKTATPTATSICFNGQFDASKSTVSVITPPDMIVQADGTSTEQLVVTVFDNCSNPLPGKTVTMSSSRGGTDVFSPASATSDVNGQAFFTVKSSVISPWDNVNLVFTPSVLSAQVGPTTLSTTRNATFVCSTGQGVPAGGNNEVFWQFTNNTGINRRLVRLDVTWPQQTGRLLQDVSFNGTQIWNLTANFSPVTINSSWVGAPTSRNLDNGVSKSLLITFNFLVTGAQQYTVKAFWDDGNGNSVCDSGSVTVIRGSGTSVPSATFVATSTPTPSHTPGPSSTPTATSPASTATPTITLTPVPPTGSPTNTPVPPTATKTLTPVPPTVTPTLTPVPPTATSTSTATPITLLGDKSIEATVDNDASGQAEAFQYSATSTGTATKLYIYVDAQNTTSQLVVGLYSDVSGQPHTLLGQGTISAPTVGAWNSVSIPGASVTSGTKYWLAVLGAAGTGSPWFRDNSSGTSSVGSSQTNLTTLPATWTTGTTYNPATMSAYAN